MYIFWLMSGMHSLEWSCLDVMAAFYHQLRLHDRHKAAFLYSHNVPEGLHVGGVLSSCPVYYMHPNRWAWHAWMTTPDA